MRNTEHAIDAVFAGVMTTSCFAQIQSLLISAKYEIRGYHEEVFSGQTFLGP